MLVVYNNVPAFNAYRHLRFNVWEANKVMEKLSSGLRINRAGDDAAGLSVSEKMRAQISGLDMAIKNAQDAISLIQTAEGAMDEIHAMLRRMRDLAIQAANDIYTTVDRYAIQQELAQLYAEINRIASTTQFNTIYLLKGERRPIDSADREGASRRAQRTKTGSLTGTSDSGPAAPL